ncbi:MAG: bifunctional oligoribonuclease/PAP phosphatase NrnA [Desulfohalobiaceae bacterium]|nr:bifunctional oligoribonuclease/PAP phosphatase NrnA [Desulfohalobiaceae bacterium]
MAKQNSASNETAKTKDKNKVAEFKGVLEAHKGEHHVIVLQKYPDPDAIASAFAHQVICRNYDIEADILYTGRISHQQNKALVNLLKISLTRYTKGQDLSGYKGAVFVDTQGGTAREVVKSLEADGVPALIIIDHHEPLDILCPEFSDIRRIGAAATIYTQYIESGLLKMKSGDEEHVKLATALMHGILTDTNGFLRAGPEDFQAAAFLSRYHDLETLEYIMEQERSKKTMEIISKSLSKRVVAESFSIAGIGYLKTNDRDAIPQAADFLVTEENVHTAIVFGIVTGEEGEFLVGSLRTTKISLDPDEFIKDVFGRDSQGKFFGGGKVSAGGFQMPIGFLSGGESQEYQNLKWQTFDAKIKERIFSKIGYDKKNGFESDSSSSDSDSQA